MNLARYLDEACSRGERADRVRRLAAELGVTPAFIGQIALAKRPCPADRAAAIERACEGIVRRQDLRPDDWRSIWPELVVGAEGAPAMPAEEHSGA